MVRRSQGGGQTPYWDPEGVEEEGIIFKTSHFCILLFISNRIQQKNRKDLDRPHRCTHHPHTYSLGRLDNAMQHLLSYTPKLGYIAIRCFP